MENIYTIPVTDDWVLMIRIDINNGAIPVATSGNYMTRDVNKGDEQATCALPALLDTIQTSVQYLMVQCRLAPFPSWV